MGALPDNLWSFWDCSQMFPVKFCHEYQNVANFTTILCAENQKRCKVKEHHKLQTAANKKMPQMLKCCKFQSAVLILLLSCLFFRLSYLYPVLFYYLKSCHRVTTAALRFSIASLLILLYAAHTIALWIWFSLYPTIHEPYHQIIVQIMTAFNFFCWRLLLKKINSLPWALFLFSSRESDCLCYFGDLRTATTTLCFRIASLSSRPRSSSSPTSARSPTTRYWTPWGRTMASTRGRTRASTRGRTRA